MGPNVFAREASACEGRDAISASTFSSCVTWKVESGEIVGFEGGLLEHQRQWLGPQ